MKRGKKPMNDKFPLVEVEWVDATQCSGDVHSLEEARKHSVSYARTAGFLIKQTKTEITLCMTHFYGTELPQNEEAEMGFKLLWTIPRGCIKSLKLKD